MTETYTKETVFGSQYAGSYDFFYRDKNYEAECDMIEEVFRRYGNSEIKTILDLGCGTGNHAIPLSLKGYHVTGVDRSPHMIQIAKEKTPSAVGSQPSAFGSHSSAGPRSSVVRQPSSLNFVTADLKTLDLHSKYDAVLMMFAVLGYQLTNDDVLAALRVVRNHLKPGGLFICDLWYGPAVLAIRPSDRFKVIPTKDGKILRSASGRLDIARHAAVVDYQIWRLQGTEVVSESSETHRMRYFFPRELDLFMSATRLNLLDIKAFGDLDRPPEENDWNILAIAEAVP